MAWLEALGSYKVYTGILIIVVIRIAVIARESVLNLYHNSTKCKIITGIMSDYHKNFFSYQQFIMIL